MFQNQSFSSGSYEDMLSGTTLLPHHNNYTESVGSQNELKFITSLCDTVSMQPVDGSGTGNLSRVVVSRAQLGLVDSDQNMQGQGLSLSLGTVMPSISSVPPFQYQYPNNSSSSSLMNNAPMQNLKVNDKPHREDDEATLHRGLRNAECMDSVSFGGFYKREGLYNGTHSSMCLNEGQPGFSNTVLNSQYLKAAQELLNEIVSVRKALKQPGLEKQQSFCDAGLDGSKDSDGKSTGQSMHISSAPSGSTANSSSELSPAERQNLLDKKTKLLAMLDEVDKRYRQYCHQIQIVVSAFDMVSGCGAAEPYTALALRTISRHFRCLRDAISRQIQATQRSLGEQEGIPRLRNVDQQLRQPKALQQLSVMRHAWRPQRGLPESSVSILRAWLFEHFLHPYPNDSEKIMLARQTGLTRNQVANWFINARVRLWKPMVEEMYKDEFGDSEMSCNLSSENDTPNASSRDDVQASDNKPEEESQDNLVTLDSAIQHRQLQISDHGQNVMDSRTRNNNHPYSNASAIPISNHNVDGGCCLMDSTTAPAATCVLSEFGNFGGHVSLALELRNCDVRSTNQTASLASSSVTDLLDYHLTDPGKQQHTFGNPHLLHEFVV